MRHKSPVKRRQKVAPPPPAYRIENEINPEAMPQYFQITVNVLEAKKLVWTNPRSANSYVIVVLGKEKHRTSIRRNMEEPQYKESLVFETYVSIRDIQQSTLWLAVMEPRCCAPPRLLGETTIDLGAIWAQPHHQVFHKWAQLSLPRDPAIGAVGFLKVDISIIFRGDVQVMPAIVNDEKVEDNLLLPSGSEQQRANYLVTIYGAFSLPSGTTNPGDRRYGKPPSTFVKVSFCGLVAKTAVQARNNNPSYCEQISIVEMFPNMSQMIRLEVCSGEGCFNKVLASTHLRLEKVSHDGENGFLPTFGPSLLHMYGTSSVGTLETTVEDGPYYRGTLLVSLQTVVPYYRQSVRSTSVEPVASVKTENLWSLEDFCIFCPILEVSMLDNRIAGKFCGVAITIGEIPNYDRGDEGMVTKLYTTEYAAGRIIKNNCINFFSEFFAMMNEIRSRKLHYTGSLDVLKTRPAYGYLDFSNAFPVLQLATRLPDFRFRMYRNNMVYGIVADLEIVIEDVERCLKNFEYNAPKELSDQINKALDDAAGKILKFLDIVQFLSPNNSSDNMMKRYSTELDQKQLALQKEEIQKIYQQISKRAKCNSTINPNRSIDMKKNTKDSIAGSRKEVKRLSAETKALAQSLKNLIYKSSEGWPDIVVWLLNGGSRVAYSKLSAADVIHSVIPEQSGRNCGRIQTVYLKPLKCSKHLSNSATGCFCIAGKIELLVWMGLYRQMSAFEGCVSNGYKLRIKDYDMCLKGTTVMLECRVFVYRAKLNNVINNENLAYTFVRINALNSVKETNVKQKTLTPVWNQVLKIYKMVCTSQERLLNNPPVVLIEVCEKDLSGKTELMGRFQIQPVMDDRQDFQYAPKLQWYEIFKGAEYTGQVLMSVQLLQIPETLMKSTVYGSVDETYYVSDQKELEPDSETVEPLPANLIPQSTTYKVDIYWWGLRDVNITRKPCVIFEIEELIIKSDIIIDKKSNCNFPNGRTSQIFEAPLNEAYCPPLNIRLYDSSTFGRTVYLGTNIVKNPNKYIVNWVPKNEREASLRSASITSSDFFQVTPLLYIKNSRAFNQDSNEYISNTSMTSSIKSKAKRSNWKKLFSRREPDEEEYVLLPMFTKENDDIKVVKNIPKICEVQDWWMRYFSSQNEYNGDEHVYTSDKITIYDSELEAQPEFYRFKDWCSTLKLYNGKKTGIPEKDEQLYCGFVKAGIAIYRWPPSQNTIAVSPNGVDLKIGYFSDFPNNDTTKFLVRVYVVKCVDLMAGDFSGKSDPYIVISCGKKHLGDRNNYIANSVNPVFGKMYEFRCTLPEDYLLTFSVYNHDAVSPDEVIGSTTIDLEDRIYSKHRPCVGLSTEYNLAGPAKWRDLVKPSVILEDLCSKNHIPQPIFPDSVTVIVNGVEYKDSEGNNRKTADSLFHEKCSPPPKDTNTDMTIRCRSVQGAQYYTSSSECKENVCLSLLHNWHTLPICGHHLVPEHVETRSLFNHNKLGLDQGKVQMWVDIFPLDTGMPIPLPVDITPRKIEDYELRLIVWDVQGIRLDDGKTVADIYVKAWIGSSEQAQYTDVHYHSSFGDGCFNWRMIFHFQYQHTERRLIKKEKGPFTEFEEQLPPVIIVQVLDSDAVSQDDSIAALMLNLNAMPRGMKLAQQCTMDAMEKSRKINLFSTRSIRAWWPLATTDRNTGMNVTAGMIDLEMTLLPADKAIVMPVGLGREPPCPLPEPCRYREASGCAKPLLNLEGLFRYGGVEYLVIGVILVITFLAAALYMELPSVIFEFLFE